MTNQEGSYLNLPPQQGLANLLQAGRLQLLFSRTKALRFPDTPSPCFLFMLPGFENEDKCHDADDDACGGNRSFFKFCPQPAEYEGENKDKDGQECCHGVAE